MSDDRERAGAEDRPEGLGLGAGIPAAGIPAAGIPAARPAGAGWRWIQGGFQLFMKQPVMWIGIFLIYTIISVLLSVLPLVSLLSTLLAPVFAAGLVYGAWCCHERGDLQIAQLFAGFGPRFGRLFLLGVLVGLGLLLTLFASSLILGLMVGVENLQLLEGQDFASDPEAVAALSWAGLVAILVGSLLFMPLMMAYWFAPAVLVFDGSRSAFQAMQLSFRGCLRNVLPLLVYGLLLIPLMLLGVLTLGLGMLVIGPVLIASNYVAYRDIFTV